MIAALALALVLIVPAFVSAQDRTGGLLELLEDVVPGADRFTDRIGQPPVFEAYRSDYVTGQETLIGYAFLTSDLPPEQKGFSGPIEVLVGMDLDGVLTGIVVTRYNESHRMTRGDFLSAEGFQEQFRGKSVLDAFRVRRDVDGITGATITVDAMSRGVRNAARAVSSAYRLGAMASISEDATLDPISVTLDQIERLSWPQLLARGLAQQISVLVNERIATDVTLVYLRDESVMEALIGRRMSGEVLERVGALGRDPNLVLAGVDGPSAGALNLARMSIVQDGDTLGLEGSDVLLFGPPREGKLDGQIGMARVLLIDRAVDMTRPFAFLLDLRPGLGVFSTDYPGEQSVAGGNHPSAGVSTGLAALCMLLLIIAGALAARRVGA